MTGVASAEVKANRWFTVASVTETLFFGVLGAGGIAIYAGQTETLDVNVWVLAVIALWCMRSTALDRQFDWEHEARQRRNGEDASRGE